MGRPDDERDIPDGSDSSPGAVPGSAGHDSHSMRALEKQMARFEQSVLSEIRALQSKIDQLAASTNPQRIAALEEKFTAALVQFAEMARQWETSTGRVPTPATRLSAADDDRKADAFGQNREVRSFEIASAALATDRSEPSAEPSPPILTAAEPNTLLKSYHAEPGGPQEQKKQLQQRISADIERVRAELRKRAGVAR